MSNNELLKVLADYMSVSALIKEAEKEKAKLADAIKQHMGAETVQYIGQYSITYKEVTKTVADVDRMKAAGVYETFSKKQVTRPLCVR